MTDVFWCFDDILDIKMMMQTFTIQFLKYSHFRIIKQIVISDCWLLTHVSL